MHSCISPYISLGITLLDLILGKGIWSAALQRNLSWLKVKEQKQLAQLCSGKKTLNNTNFCKTSLNIVEGRKYLQQSNSIYCLITTQGASNISKISLEMPELSVFLV